LRWSYDSIVDLEATVRVRVLLRLAALVEMESQAIELKNQGQHRRLRPSEVMRVSYLEGLTIVAMTKCESRMLRQLGVSLPFRALSV
jgi:hypothetical protein